MYKNILIALDNSDDANTGIELCLEIAARDRAALTGCHVYAAKLHDERFRLMEDGLPERFREPAALSKQRAKHDDLITSGLRSISESYGEALQGRAKERGLSTTTVHREGKNFDELIKELHSGPYDLLVLGANGLGRVATSRIGSVAARVSRNCEKDILIAREESSSAERGAIVAAVDGSEASFNALRRAIELAGIFNLPIEAVSVYDPDYHYAAFRSLAAIVPDRMAGGFNFKEQESLHEEIIDQGLKKIYEGHLSEARSIAAGVEIKTTLLSGKPFDEMLKYAATTKPFITALGRNGVHARATTEIGSNTENCIRELDCHTLVACG